MANWVRTTRRTVHRASSEQVRPVRRLLIFASLATLALNVMDPIVSGHFGKAAFDAVGSLLLMGWADVGPELLRGIAATQHPSDEPATSVDHVADARSRPSPLTVTWAN